jgi:hypothetical protein
MIEGTATGNVLMKNNYRVFVKKVLQIYPNLEKTVTENTGNKSSFMAPIPAVSGFDYTTVTLKRVLIRLNALIDDHGGDN